MTKKNVSQDIDATYDGASANIRAATAKAIRATAMLKQASAEVEVFHA